MERKADALRELSDMADDGEGLDSDSDSDSQGESTEKKGYNQTFEKQISARGERKDLELQERNSKW
jgi:hypothetical protein